MPYTVSQDEQEALATQRKDKTRLDENERKIREVALLRVRAQNRSTFVAPSPGKSQLAQLSAPQRSDGPRPSSNSVGPTGAQLGAVQGKWAKQLRGAKSIKQTAKMIEGFGFNVSGLEGLNGTPEVTSGHTEGSLHYGPPGPRNGLAMDITGSGLGRLYSALRKAFGTGILDEMFYKNKAFGLGEGPIGGHDTHIHAGFLGRRF